MKHLAIILSIALLALSCNRTEPVEVPGGKNYKVILCATGAGDDVSLAESKTYIGSDGKSVYWSDDDRLALWAVNPLNKLELDAVPFTLFGVSDARALFSTELGKPMEAPGYTYYASSPLPATSHWPNAYFDIPEIQDGTGQGIMIAAPVEGPGLRGIEDSPEGGLVQLNLEQQLHLLKFWISDPTGQLGGETVQRIDLFFPQMVIGSYKKDVTDLQAAGVLINGGYNLTLNLASPLPGSSAGDRKYACATIYPRKWGNLSELSGTIYTETRIADFENVPFNGRDMAAGHTTAIRLQPVAPVQRSKVYLYLASNPLGEPIESITLTAPSGCKWGDQLGNSYVWYTGTDISEGSVLELEYENTEAFRTLSGKSITVTFDSEHVRTQQTVTVPNLADATSTSLNLRVPPLLDENFASVGSFSSSDEYGTANAGSKNAYSFLNGWTGGRIGASAGKCIRIACRRETSADYDARVDSAPLTGTIKKSCNLKVEFSYGSNNQFGGFAIITDGNVGQTCYVGYVTNAKGYKSGDTDGTYSSDNAFYTKEYTGSWTNTPNDTDYTLTNVPANSLIRISWRTVIEHQAGTTNTTCWLYLDNIKVTIAQ